MPGKISLFVPGPTNMPDRVRQAMDISNEDHRAPGMDKFWHPLISDLRKVFETTSGQPFIFPGTGSSGWEAALTNLLNKGDKVLSARFGQFSHLWIEMCKKLHIDVEVVDVEWGGGTPHDEFEKILSEDKNHEIKAVLVTQNETSTGVTNDVKASRDLLNKLNHPALLFVDGVSSIGSIKFEMDSWGVDVAVSGSQKGFMLPAGLAISCVSQKGLEIAKSSNLPRAYFDYHDMMNVNETGYWPYTNPMPLLRGLREALDMMMEEGLDNIYSRHHFLAQAVQKATQAWGLNMCAQDPSLYSNTVTAIMVPEGIDSTDIVKTAYNKYNTSFGGGLNKVAGKLFRIGHLGDLNSTMILGAISTAELAMYDVVRTVKKMSDRLYVGIDLGTYQSTIASSAGISHTIETVVGRPKDPVARNFLGRDVLFGNDALKNKLACNIYRPMAAGVAQDDEANLAAAKAFVSHLLETVDPEEYDEVFGVICSPSHVSFTDKSNLVATLRGQVNAIMVVTEPFATAYGIGEIASSIVVDIGAGTTDIARIYGTFPTDEDQVTIQEAGDWLDNELMTLIRKKFTGAQVTKDMVRKWKEEVSYVGGEVREATVELSVEGKKQVVDIGDLVAQACELIIPKIGNAIKRIVAGADPEYQPVLRNNIILSGGGSLIDGIAARMTDEISDIGDVTVWCVEDPINAVANGALLLAGEMPDDMYTAIN